MTDRHVHLKSYPGPWDDPDPMRSLGCPGCITLNERAEKAEAEVERLRDELMRCAPVHVQLELVEAERDKLAAEVEKLRDEWRAQQREVQDWKDRTRWAEQRNADLLAALGEAKDLIERLAHAVEYPQDQEITGLLYEVGGVADAVDAAIAKYGGEKAEAEVERLREEVGGDDLEWYDRATSAEAERDKLAAENKELIARPQYLSELLAERVKNAERDKLAAENADLLAALPDPDKLEWVAKSLDLSDQILNTCLDQLKITKDGKHDEESERILRHWLGKPEVQSNLYAWAAGIRAAITRAKGEGT